MSYIAEGVYSPEQNFIQDAFKELELWWNIAGFSKLSPQSCIYLEIVTPFLNHWRILRSSPFPSLFALFPLLLTSSFVMVTFRFYTILCGLVHFLLPDQAPGVMWVVGAALNATFKSNKLV